MKHSLTITNLVSKKVTTKNFKSKKDLQRWQSNNYTKYTW